MPDTAPDTAPPVDRLKSLPKLGAGLSFQGTLRDFVLAEMASFDFLEIIPDTFWVDHGVAAPSRYEERQDAAPFLDEVAAHRPIVCHSVGLSIGSAELFDTRHVRQIAAWEERYRFPWHSDHLSFNRLEHATGHSIDVGFTMPVPYDEAVLAMLAERVDHVQAQVPVPFLLENNVYYFQIPGQDMSEPEFLNRLAARTGCGLLLDLHNVYVNSRNHGFAPWDFLGDLDLTRVVEIHLAGGLMMDGVYLDAHSGPVPDEVWKLLADVLPQAPNVCGVVFEMFGNYYPTVGPDQLRGELLKVRRALDRVL